MRLCGAARTPTEEDPPRRKPLPPAGSFDCGRFAPSAQDDKARTMPRQFAEAKAFAASEILRLRSPAGSLHSG